MSNRFVLLILLACAAAGISACADQDDQRHPALKVADPPSGYYDIDAAAVATTCPNQAVINDRTPPAWLEIAPRADLATGTYYLRLEGWKYLGATNFPEVAFDAENFRGSTVSPLIFVVNRAVTATIDGQRSGSQLKIRYVDDIAANEQGPGCQIEWSLAATRRMGLAYETVFVPVTQDCVDQVPVPIGALLQASVAEDHSWKFQFDFDGGVSETLAPVLVAADGRFDHQQAMSSLRTVNFRGTLSQDGLDAAYLDEFQSSGAVGSDCSMTWEIQARRIR